MKNLLILLLLVSGALHAQTTFYTDQYGQPAGAAIQQGNMTFYTDGQGRPIGAAIDGQPSAPPQLPAYQDRRQNLSQSSGYSGPNYSINTPSPYTPDSLRSGR